MFLPAIEDLSVERSVYLPVLSYWTDHIMDCLEVTSHFVFTISEANFLQADFFAGRGQ